MSSAHLDRVTALSCDRALTGLTPEREAELVSLLPPGARLDPGLELAAAAIALSEVVIDEPLPAHLRDRILLGARAMGARAEAPTVALMPAPMRAGGTVPLPAGPRSEGSAPPRAEVPSRREPGPENVVPLGPRRSSAWLPWAAAAACLALAVGSVVASRVPRATLAVTVDPAAMIPLPSAAPPEPPATLASKRARLLAEAKDVVRTTWAATTDPAGKGESGEVVWSNERQEGYMTFRAVAANDPKQAQYQLWIFDGERDERFPVDGGVFDVDPSSGEVVVPIVTRLPVRRPTLFAVTVEQPGGVVVSKRERIVVAAKVAG